MAGPDRRKLGRRLFGSCLIFLVFAAIAWFAVSRLLAAVPDPPRTPFAAISSFFIALGAFSFWGLATGGGNTQHSRKALIRRAENGGVPEDGQPILSSGKVRAEGKTLTAPVSGTPCVAYFYRMFYWGKSLTSSRPMPVVVYWGLASQPFSLHGTREQRRVTAVPRLQIQSNELPGEMARQAARNWVASTTFSEEENGNLGAVATAFTIADEMFTDEDGVTRRDWSQAGANRDLSQLHFEETVLPVGAEAAACGTWSQSRNAIVSGDGMNGILGVTVALGGPESIPEDAVANKSMATYVVTATALTLVGMAIAWVALRFFPPS